MITATQRKARQQLGSNIKRALDGRTQRWLAEKIRMPEDYLSNKLKGKFPFTAEEILSINQTLETEFELI